MSKITLKRRQEALAYIRGIKQDEKRHFAQAYYNWLAEGMPVTPRDFKLSKMTKQLIIVKLTDFFIDD